MLLILIILLAFALLSLSLFLNARAQLKELKSQMGLHHSQHEKNHMSNLSSGLSEVISDCNIQILRDPLTGLPGREAFQDRLGQTIYYSKRFSKIFGIVLFNIDDFSQINKTYGEEVGDKLLIEVSKRLQPAIRQIDTMSRFAGDIFMFLLPELMVQEAAALVAQRILDSIAAPLYIDEHKITITASIGISIYPTDGEESATLFKAATAALTRAKESGKGKFQFHSQKTHALGNRDLSLRSLLDTDNFTQKMIIYYQLYQNTANKAPTCVQAVPYINLPNFGLLTFADFATSAENCGKINLIGDWVLRSALKQFQAAMQGDEAPNQLLINVTLKQVAHTHFSDSVDQLLQEYNIHPDRIIFAVLGSTPNFNLTSLERALDNLSKLKTKTAISVFSLGQLALQKITQLPIDYLIIDDKLNQTDTLENQTIVNMIIQLASDMGITILSTVAMSDEQKQYYNVSPAVLSAVVRHSAGRELRPLS